MLPNPDTTEAHDEEQHEEGPDMVGIYRRSCVRLHTWTKGTILSKTHGRPTCFNTSTCLTRRAAMATRKAEDEL
jgi:hypothetical protein